MTKLNLKVVFTTATFVGVAAACLLTFVLFRPKTIAGQAQVQQRVLAIRPPTTPLPAETASQGITKYSFIVYGDTRGRHDGTGVQYEHSLVIDSMLAQIKILRNTAYPVKFVLQSGDAVTDGRNGAQWNISFVPLINRLSIGGGVPYFLTPGNHEATTTEAGMKNYLDAVSELIPADGSPRRLKGSATYSFAYGNAFVVALDSNIAGDEKQYQWIQRQLEGLDRGRYVNVIAFCHHAPFSSGPHGGSHVEDQTIELRKRYMPLFRAHHGRAVFSGHEHLFEHWVERYTDSSGAHRMDLVVSGGGGAPLYAYSGEPDLREYLKANEAGKVRLEHLVKPGNQASVTPYHFVIVRVDGDKLEIQVIGVDWGRGFSPYGSDKTELQDAASAMKHTTP
jgi:3',5'-cyclic AMP phosphodiesterase CpdA